MTPEEVRRLRQRLDSVERLCRSYTPDVPPLFRGPGLSEHGKGYAAGMTTFASAVLSLIADQPDADDDWCCVDCANTGRSEQEGPVLVVPHGPTKPPYGSPERAAYDARQGGAR